MSDMCVAYTLHNYYQKIKKRRAPHTPTPCGQGGGWRRRARMDSHPLLLLSLLSCLAASMRPHMLRTSEANLRTRLPMYAPAPLSPYLPRVCRWQHAVLSVWSPSSSVSRLRGVLHRAGSGSMPMGTAMGGAPACPSTQQHACTALTCTCGRTRYPPAGRASAYRASACKASPCVLPATSHMHT